MKNSLKIKRAYLLSVLLFTALSVQAVSIRGIVVNARTQEPLTGATVGLVDGEIGRWRCHDRF